MVKEVKELRSELYGHPVLRSEEGVLDQSEVEVGQPVHPNIRQDPTDVAEGEGWRLNKACSIEPVAQAADCRTAEGDRR